MDGMISHVLFSASVETNTKQPFTTHSLSRVYIQNTSANLPHMRFKFHLFFQWILLAPLLSTSLRADIIINEIHFDPEPNTEEVEFIELHNNGASAEDVSGWQFTAGIAFTLPSNTSIAAGGYLVICENPTAFQAKFGGSALGPWIGKLSNNGETLTLKNPLGITIDTVDYGIGFPWPLGSRGTGSSMELIDPSLDNDLGGSWRTSGQPAVCAGSGTVATFIPEESVGWRYQKGTSSPSTDENGKTWWQNANYVEDANWLTGTGAIGYGEPFINTSLNDMSGGYTTVFLRKTFTVANAASINELIFRARFDDGVKVWINGTPVFNLLSPDSAATPSVHTSVATGSRPEADGSIYTTLNLTTPLPNSYLINGTNIIAIQLFNQGLNSGDCYFDGELKEAGGGSNSGATTPSPNAQNNSYYSSAPPQTRQINHSPETPTAGQDVLITAKVTDPNGVQSVVLHYQTVDPGNYIRRADAAYEDPSNWVNLNMVDDGSGGDAIAGDSIYTTTIPGSTQIHRRMIRYRITVTDIGDNCIRLPYGDDTQPNFAYLCHNGIPDWTGKINASSPTVTYPTAELTRVPVYQLIARNNDIENSQWNGNYNEQYLEGTLVYDGKVYDHMKFRNKGSASTYRMGHNKWKLNFNRGHRFQARTYYGKKFDTVWDKFSIQTGESPWWRNDQYPMSGMLFQESLMNRINNLTGTHAPEMIHFHFRVIDDTSESSISDQYSGDFWGIYTAQQHPDKSFFDENNLPNSNLYKLNGSSASSADKWNQGSTQVSDASDLSSFISGYKSTNDPQWWADNLERPAYYTWNTLNLSINNSDLRKEQNVIYWHNANTNRWHPSVWDVDLLFEDARHHNRDPYAAWEDLHRVLNHPAYMIEFQNRVRELQDLLLWNGQFDRNIDEVVTLLTGSASGITTNTLVDANQAQWDYHPRKNHKGIWYRIEGATYWDDLADMVTYMKAFPKPGGFGGNQLEAKALINSDTAIPNKPTISYTGTAGFPTAGISLQTTAFSDATGSVAAIQWRIGEIYDPNVSNYTLGDPWKYEITSVWESGTLTWNGNVTIVNVPVTHVKVGRTYRARVRHQDDTGRWSRWSEPLEFLSTAPDITDYRNALVVSEVHYHPLPPSTPEELGASLNKDDFEFIELMNVGTTTLDLNGVRLADAVTFDFTSSAITTLDPGERVLVVKEPAAFIARYGTGFPVAGEYSGKLSDKGELVRLSYGDGNTTGNLIRSFTYDDVAPWPPAADGDGPSMVLTDPWSVPNHNIGTNWRISHVAGGQPGEVDSWNFPAWLSFHGIPSSGATDDPDLDGLDNLVEYFLGTHPLQPSQDKTPTGALTLINPGNGEDTYFILTFQHNQNAEGVTFTAQESTDLSLWNVTGIPTEVDSTAGSGSIRTVRYRSSQPISSYPNEKLFMRLLIFETP